ncbi:MAG: YceI family protein [Phycisphaeraceae bacterium]
MKTRTHHTGIAGTSLLAVLLAGLTTFATPDAASAESYNVDPVHTSVYFNIMHMDIAPVYGRFNDVSGSYDLGDAPAFNFTVQATSVDTGNEQRDNHLRSDDFFNAAEFPAIRFQSTAVEPLDEGEGYKVTGDMTLHGETREIVIDLVKTGEGSGNGGEHRTGFHTTFTLNRSDYGMDQLLNAVGDEVTLMIGIEGVRQ